MSRAYTQIAVDDVGQERTGQPGLTRVGVWLAILAALMSSSLPSPLYVTYQIQWGLTSFWVTLLFAVYAVSVLGGLMLMVRIGDRLGDRRSAIVAATSLTASSALIMAFAPDQWTLLGGRILSGLGTGTLLGSASAALFELHPRKDARASAMNATTAFTTGAGIGSLVSGFCLDTDLWPTILPYASIGLIALLAIPAVLLTPIPIARRSHGTESGRQPAFVAGNHRARYYLASAIMILVWSIGSVFMATGQRYALELAQVDGVFVASALIAAFQFTAACGQLTGSRLSQRTSIIAGVFLAALSQIGMGVSAISGAALYFEISCVVAGIGFGLSFVGANGLLNMVTSPENRTRLLSSYYMLGYIFGNALPAIVVGVLIDGISLSGSLLAFTSWISGLALLILLSLRWIRCG